MPVRILGVPLPNRVPIDWTVLAAVLVVGGVYYAVRGRRLPPPHRVRSSEDIAAISPEVQAGPGGGAVLSSTAADPTRGRTAG